MASLLHSPADVVSRVMIAMALGSDPTASGSWPIHVAGEPSSPDNCITVYDTTPQNDGRVMPSGEQVHKHGIQIRVRATDHPTGAAKARAIKDALDQDVYDESATIDGTAYVLHSIDKSYLLTLGKDSPSTKRSLFTINCFACLKRV